ncbi:MAG TPA: hypothetical protein GXZ98_05785 [Firmicutes bacterium]|nr:hypothetical protein [Bacillota bacterium]
MLEAVLREIKKTGYLSKTKIAAALQTTTGLIEGAVTQLLSLGYLKVDDGNSPPGHCGQKCAGCPLRRRCAQQPPVKTMTITDKGERLLIDRPA